MVCTRRLPPLLQPISMGLAGPRPTAGAASGREGACGRITAPSFAAAFTQVLGHPGAVLDATSCEAKRFGRRIRPLRVTNEAARRPSGWCRMAREGKSDHPWKSSMRNSRRSELRDADPRAMTGRPGIEGVSLRPSGSSKRTATGAPAQASSRRGTPRSQSGPVNVETNVSVSNFFHRRIRVRYR